MAAIKKQSKQHTTWINTTSIRNVRLLNYMYIKRSSRRSDSRQSQNFYFILLSLSLHFVCWQDNRDFFFFNSKYTYDHIHTYIIIIIELVKEYYVKGHEVSLIFCTSKVSIKYGREEDDDDDQDEGIIDDEFEEEEFHFHGEPSSQGEQPSWAISVICTPES